MFKILTQFSVVLDFVLELLTLPASLDIPSNAGNVRMQDTETSAMK